MSLVRKSAPYRAVISENTAATLPIVAAVAGKRIVVINLILSVTSGNTVVWKSGTTAISGAIAESYTAGDSHAGILQTSKGEALQFTLSSTDPVTGHLTYVLI